MINYFLSKVEEFNTTLGFAREARLNFLYSNIYELEIVLLFCQDKEKETQDILEKMEKSVKYYLNLFKNEIEAWNKISLDYIPKYIPDIGERVSQYLIFYKNLPNVIDGVNKILEVKQEQIKLSKQIYKEHKENKTLNHYKAEMGWINETKYAKIKRISSKIRTGIFDISEFKNIPIELLLDKPVSQDRRLSLYYSPYRDDGKSPSLRVYKETNSWYDFGRGEGGDVIALYQKIHDCDFKSALEGLKKYI